MGKEIEAYATERGHSITARIDSANPKEKFDYTNTDVVIEFSRPEFAKNNIQFAIDKQLPIIIGTTGWYADLEEITKYCQLKNGSMLYATNFSVGVNAFFAVNTYLAKIMANLDAYTANVVEIHHTEKLDSPSGTGISIAEQIISENKKYNGWVNEKIANTTDKEKLTIESIRLPKVPGTHEVKYTSVIDTIEIKHTAHTRKGFAQGSVLAAEWIMGKSGVFTMQDVLKF